MSDATNSSHTSAPPAISSLTNFSQWSFIISSLISQRIVTLYGIEATPFDSQRYITPFIQNTDENNNNTNTKQNNIAMNKLCEYNARLAYISQQTLQAAVAAATIPTTSSTHAEQSSSSSSSSSTSSTNGKILLLYDQNIVDVDDLLNLYQL